MIIDIGGAGQPAQVHRQQTGTSHARRALFRWLPPGRRRPRSAAQGRGAVLRDGSTVLIRQVQPADASLLAEGFTRLSAHSRRMRFLTIKDELSLAELRYLTDVDHHDHEAVGAVDHADGRGVGIARYIRDAEDPQTAEVAVTVVDDWQGRGLGTELVAELTDRARSAGICRFTALVAADNAAITRLLRKAGGSVVGRGPGTVDYEITLPPAQEHGLDWWLSPWKDDIIPTWR
jgi:RimJ/RimL family protein N-acetyltransferase